MTDTIALVAGILLTSTGLLALLPFVLRAGRRAQEAHRLEGALLPALAAADAFMHPSAHFNPMVHARRDGVNEETEELMAHLFSLRMTVSEVTADVQAIQDALDVTVLEVDAEAVDSDLEQDAAETVA